jgi:hypothetical protein
MMKKKVIALAMAVLMLGTLALAGCKKEAPVAADQVAMALFNMILKDDASSVVELFGYADEAEARKDMGIEGGFYETMADEVVNQFTAMGMNVSNEDAQAFIDAFLTMFKGVDMTAKVKSSDEKAGTAVVTCTISTFDSNALNEAMMKAMSDPSVMSIEDEDAAVSAMLKAISSAIAGLTPSGESADFDVDFELADMDVNGKTKKVWVPKDAEEFGNLISTTAIGG